MLKNVLKNSAVKPSTPGLFLFARSDSAFCSSSIVRFCSRLVFALSDNLGKLCKAVVKRYCKKVKRNDLPKGLVMKPCYSSTKISLLSR